MFLGGNYETDFDVWRAESSLAPGGSPPGVTDVGGYPHHARIWPGLDPGHFRNCFGLSE